MLLQEIREDILFFCYKDCHKVYAEENGRYDMLREGLIPTPSSTFRPNHPWCDHCGFVDFFLALKAMEFESCTENY